jgi:hypothetical protein
MYAVCTTQSCETGGCGCGEKNCNCDFYKFMEQKLMQMTFWAHKEVLFEKIKQKITETEGEKLDKIADLLVDAGKDKLKAKKDATVKKDELRKNLKDLFEE